RDWSSDVCSSDLFQLSLASQTFGRYPRFRQAGLPLWWTEGLAEFFSAGEDSRDEMVLRDMTIDGHLPSLPDLAYAYGGLVYPVGGSIHRFLAERYGEWRILELYNDIWKYSSFEGALAGVYGRTIDELSDEWQYWMRQHYYPAVASQPPLAITARKLTELAIKPTARSEERRVGKGCSTGLAGHACTKHCRPNDDQY